MQRNVLNKLPSSAKTDFFRHLVKAEMMYLPSGVKWRILCVYNASDSVCVCV